MSVTSIIAICYICIQSAITVAVSVAVAIVKETKTNGDRPILWFKTMWKMRNVYSALAVQIFDVMTDILVIGQWYNAESGDNLGKSGVDSKVMAFCSIGVLVFYHVMSSIAVAMIADKQWFQRALLQLLGLLIFEEIFIAHKKIVEKYHNTQVSGL